MHHYIDLHTHSSASDGTDAPAELVARASELSLAVLALTDHETLSGLDKAVAAGEKHGVAVIRGCELSSFSPYGEVHIVGLWLPGEAVGLEAALARFRSARDARNREMVERFRRAGFGVSYEELLAEAAGESVGRPHMARLLVRKGICPSTREAFAKFLGDGKSMHVPRPLPAPEEALALLRGEGATAVLAHPMLLDAPPAELEMLVKRLAGSGLDAIEVFHSKHDAADVCRAGALARRHGLAVSGGSDYHGSARPEASLGRIATGDGRIPPGVLENLLACRMRQGQHLYGFERFLDSGTA